MDVQLLLPRRRRGWFETTYYSPDERRWCGWCGLRRSGPEDRSREGRGRRGGEDPCVEGIGVGYAEEEGVDAF